MESKSRQKVYAWIRDKDEDAELPRCTPIVESFPDGPHDESQGLVDIVIITPASTSWRSNVSFSRPTVPQSMKAFKGMFWARYCTSRVGPVHCAFRMGTHTVQHDELIMRPSMRVLHRLTASRLPPLSRKPR